ARLAATDAGHERRSELLNFERPDGTQVAVEVASIVVEWNGQPARRVSLTHFADASARLRRQVTGVLSDLTEAIIITDLHFHIRSWNTAAERLYGWAERDALGRHIFDVVRWVGDGGHLAAAWESLERKGRWIGEADQLTRDGSVACVRTSMTLLRESGEAVGVVSVNRLAGAIADDASHAADEDAEARLHRAIKDQRFEVYYQPVNDLVRGDVIGVEALLRWNDTERGVLMPADFLAAAERSGLIVELGNLVLETACRQAAEWRGGGADIALSVNLSTRQLSDPGLVDRIVEALAASGLDPAFLSLEITETSLVQSIEEATEALLRLVELGIGIAIDDFGTGWASLTYLRTFPVNSLKIDRSFVAGVGHDPNDRAIVRSILSLGAELDLLVVAEGVETVEQQTALRKLGCSTAQGFLYGRPTPAGEVPIHRARRLVPPA
ncbi:MAG TPA: EAL domain-containing protein, partial [Acidimicrobiales bacterium]|nr:EAL domain-containing protein [Acidimicrobiales bacterium]